MNILFVRTSAIGDVVMSSGLIPALKEKYPDGKITWLVESAASSILADNELIDQIKVWDKKSWVTLFKARKYTQLWRRISSFRKELRQQKFDLAIDAQGIFKSSFLAWLSGAPVRIGSGKKEGSTLFNTQSIERDENHPDMCSEYKQLGAHLELNPDTIKMYLPYSDDTRARSMQLLRDALDAAPTDPAGSYIVICPFTTRPQKHWFDDHWAQLALHLKDNYQKQIIVLGGPADHEHAERIQSMTSVPLINLAGKTSLLEAIAIIDSSTAVIGVDTGLTHIGIAKDKPTVALFGSTRPYLNPDSDKARVIYEDMSCAPCRRNPTCNGQFTCMRNLTAEKVLHALDEVFA